MTSLNIMLFHPYESPISHSRDHFPCSTHLHQSLLDACSSSPAKCKGTVLLWGALPPPPPEALPKSISRGRNSSCPGLSCCSFLHPCCSAQPPTNTRTTLPHAASLIFQNSSQLFPVKPITQGHFPKKLITALEKREGAGSTQGERHAAKGQHNTASRACNAPGAKDKS